MNALKRRVASLEGNRKFLTIGELLDNLDGHPLPVGKVLSPAMLTALGRKGAQHHA